MGGCIYTPGQKNAYIPINHIDINTKERLDWQLTENDIKEEFSRLSDTNIIMHNGKFDYEVIKCTCGLPLKIYWDTMVAARLLNENEKSAGLKQQYIEKIDNDIEKYSIESLFENIEYAIIDPELFALYSATDSFMTYNLYKWQREQFSQEPDTRLYRLFLDVEMPIVEVSAEMELRGICLDTSYANILSEKYHKKMTEIDTKINDELKNYEEQIKVWRTLPESTNRLSGASKSKSEQLKDPVEVGSPTQLAILLYDILKTPIVDKKYPRGTGEDILKKINIPLTNLVLEKRELEKLTSTYIDKLPKCINSKDNRLHGHFNQLGTDTGRFSSTDPNLQNIPSHEKSIRMMFVPQEGYSLVGSDFSQQEPRLLANFAQDENMINAYKAGKDLYATIAAQIYHNKYEDNLEKHPDGTANPDGKKRRTSVKSLVLGVMYSMGANSLAQAIKGTYEEAQDIINGFYKAFPKVKKWMDESLEMGRTKGYVTDLWGRKRRLEDLALEKYIITDPNARYENPLLDVNVNLNKNTKIDEYLSLLNKAKNRQDVERIKGIIYASGLNFRENSGKIAQAERQCVNARIQGSAATMSKRAMINVYKDKELNDLGFHILLAIHDELIGECPSENAEAAGKRLSEVMKMSGLPECVVPMKCDVEITSRWYEGDYLDKLRLEFSEMIDEGKTKEESIKELLIKYPESQIFDLNECLGE